MNKTTGLTVSILLNVILVGSIVSMYVTRPDSRTAVSDSPQVTQSTTGRDTAFSAGEKGGVTQGGEGGRRSASRPGGVRQAIRPGEPTNKFEVDPDRVMKFSSAFTELVGQLRQSGVADESLSALIGAELGRQWQDQRTQIERDFRLGKIDQRDRQEFYAHQETERDQTMKSLLGEDAYVRIDKNSVLRNLNTDGLGLSPEETDKLYQLRKESAKFNAELGRMNAGGEIDPVDFNAERKRQQQQDDDQLKAILGPQRYAEFKMNNDWGYGQLRRDVRDLNLGDSQVNSIYAANRQFQDEQRELEQLIQSGQLTGKDAQDQIAAAQAARDQQLQQLLGQQGYADYRMTQDDRYRQMVRYAPAWQLSSTDIQNVYRTLDAYKQSIRTTRADSQTANSSSQKISQQQLDDMLRNTAARTEQNLRISLGDDRYDKLKRAGIIQLNN